MCTARPIIRRQLGVRCSKRRSKMARCTSTLLLRTRSEESLMHSGSIRWRWPPARERSKGGTWTDRDPGWRTRLCKRDRRCCTGDGGVRVHAHWPRHASWDGQWRGHCIVSHGQWRAERERPGTGMCRSSGAVVASGKTRGSCLMCRWWCDRRWKGWRITCTCDHCGGVMACGEPRRQCF